MEYRFTDTNKATATVDLTISDLDELRAILQAVLDAKVEDVSRWRVRGFISKLIDAQGHAAEIMAVDAKALADKVAKLRETK